MSALADDFTASDLEDVGVVKCALRAIGTAFSRLAPEEQHGQSVGLRAAATFVAKNGERIPVEIQLSLYAKNLKDKAC